MATCFRLSLIYLLKKKRESQTGLEQVRGEQLMTEFEILDKLSLLKNALNLFCINILLIDFNDLCLHSNQHSQTALQMFYIVVK